MHTVEDITEYYTDALMSDANTVLEFTDTINNVVDLLNGQYTLEAMADFMLKTYPDQTIAMFDITNAIIEKALDVFGTELFLEYYSLVRINRQNTCLFEDIIYQRVLDSDLTRWNTLRSVYQMTEANIH